MRRARRLRWAGLAAAVAVLAGVVAAIAVTRGGSGSAASGSGAAGTAAAGPAPAAGAAAPAGTFTTVSGQTRTIASLRGHPVLVWLVATWCPSCQAGTQAVASQLISPLARMHVRVVELEDYADLGQPGPAIAAFGRQYAGARYGDPDWAFGTASQAMTQAWNRQGYLDVYFLLNSAGRVVYINSAPGSTGSQLLARAAGLS